MSDTHNLIIPEKEKINKLYTSYIPLLKEILSNIEENLKATIHLSSMPTYKSRIKSFNSYYKKILRQKPDQTEQTEKLVTLTDLMGIRVICAFLEDLSEVEQQVKSAYDIVEIERKGEDLNFKEFGYESIHILIKIPSDCLPTVNTDLPLPEDLVCEIQIRTILQDAWSEVEHELVYKAEFNPFDKPLRRKLASMNASLTLSDIIFQEIRDYQKKLQGELAFRSNNFYEKADKLSVEKLGYVPEIEPLEEAQYTKKTIDDLVLEALHAHNTGNLVQAIKIYTQIVNCQPTPNNIVMSVILKHRGMAYFAQNDYEKAYSDFVQSVKYDPSSFKSYYYQGIVLGVQNKNQQAIECFTKSLELDKFQSHVYYRRALSYFNLKEYQLSLTDLDNAGKLGLDNDECRLLRSKLVAKFDMGM